MLLYFSQKYFEKYSLGSCAFVMMEARRVEENADKVVFATRREREWEKDPACRKLAQEKSNWPPRPVHLEGWACHCYMGCLPCFYSLCMPKASVQLLAQGMVMLMKQKTRFLHAGWSQHGWRRQSLSEIGDLNCRSLKTEPLKSPYRKALISLMGESSY